MVLPGAAYTEKPGTYVNTEGRVQLAQPRRLSRRATLARIGRSCAPCRSALGKTLPYDTLDQVRTRLVRVNSSFAALDQQAPAAGALRRRRARSSDAPFVSPIANFYMTCPDQPVVRAPWPSASAARVRSGWRRSRA